MWDDRSPEMRHLGHTLRRQGSIPHTSLVWAPGGKRRRGRLKKNLSNAQFWNLVLGRGCREGKRSEEVEGAGDGHTGAIFPWESCILSQVKVMGKIHCMVSVLLFMKTRLLRKACHKLKSLFGWTYFWIIKYDLWVIYKQSRSVRDFATVRL